MRRAEGTLSFEFRTALSVDQPETAAQPLKCVDFLAQEQDATWMIEITDALKALPEERRSAVADLLGQMASGRLTKDMLMKLYGTHAHMAQARIEPGARVFFCVILGLPSAHGREDSAQRIRIRDEILRVTNRVGPSFHGTSNRPLILIESVESWNASYPDRKATRLP